MLQRLEDRLHDLYIEFAAFQQSYDLSLTLNDKDLIEISNRSIEHKKDMLLLKMELLKLEIALADMDDKKRKRWPFGK